MISRSKILPGAYFFRLQTITDHQFGEKIIILIILVVAYPEVICKGNVYTLIYTGRGNKLEHQRLALINTNPAGNDRHTGLRYWEDSLMHSRRTAGVTSFPGVWLIRFFGSALLFALGGASADNTTIEIGILPTLSTRTILATYQPLREYVEEKLGQPVTLVTAADYRTFLDRTQRGEYRFVVTAPHYARLAQSEAGYVPMVRLTRLKPPV